MICIGRVIKAVGLRGEVKIDTACPSYFVKGASLCIANQPFVVSASREHKGLPVVRLHGLASVEDAKKFIGEDVYAHREEYLESDEVLETDLLGLTVFERGESIGKVQRIDEMPWGSLLVIGNDEILIPFREPFIVKVDLEGKRIEVKLIEGMR